MITMSIIFFFIAIILSMFGKGGGEFYLPLLLSFGLPYQKAATMTLFILMISGTTMTIVFRKKALIDGTTGIFIILFSSAGAFLGGLISADINPAYLKLIFAILLLISAYFLSRPPKKQGLFQIGRMWKRTCCGETYSIPVFFCVSFNFSDWFCSWYGRYFWRRFSGACVIADRKCPFKNCLCH